jgi:hypothetical protein
MMARIKSTLKTMVVAHLPYDKETHQITAQDRSCCFPDDILEWKIAGINERMGIAGPRSWENNRILQNSRKNG